MSPGVTRETRIFAPEENLHFGVFIFLLYPLPAIAIPVTDGVGLGCSGKTNGQKYLCWELYKFVQETDIHLLHPFSFTIVVQYTLSILFYWREGLGKKQFIEIGEHVGSCLAPPVFVFQSHWILHSIFKAGSWRFRIYNREEQ